MVRLDLFVYTSQMKQSSVTETKNGLSAILEQVKAGETFLITEHGKPVARLEPVKSNENRTTEEAALGDLERRGVVLQGKGRVRKELLDQPAVKLPRGVSVLEALLEERRSGR